MSLQKAFNFFDQIVLEKGLWSLKHSIDLLKTKKKMFIQYKPLELD